MRIIGTYLKPHGKNHIRVYRTDLGHYTTIELAEYLGITPSGLRQRRYKYGDTDQIIYPPAVGRPGGGGGNEEWKKLGDTKRCG